MRVVSIFLSNGKKKILYCNYSFYSARVVHVAFSVLQSTSCVTWLSVSYHSIRLNNLLLHCLKTQEHQKEIHTNTKQTPPRQSFKLSYNAEPQVELWRWRCVGNNVVELGVPNGLGLRLEWPGFNSKLKMFSAQSESFDMSETYFTIMLTLDCIILHIPPQMYQRVHSGRLLLSIPDFPILPLSYLNLFIFLSGVCLSNSFS